VLALYLSLRPSRKASSEPSSASLQRVTRIQRPASEAEAPEALRPSKRKKVAPSSPPAKRAREVLSTAATRKAEAEKKRLKLIDTSNKAQPSMRHFFKPSG
jgi:hypothetical protein